MDKVETSRRGVLGAVALAAIAGGATFAAMPSVPAPDRAEWERGFAAMLAAREAERAATAIYNPIYESWTKGKPNLSSIDWYAFPFADKAHIAHIADINAMERAWLAEEGSSWSRSPEKRDEFIARRRVSYESVREYRRRLDANDTLHDWDAANDRYDAAVDRRAEADMALVMTPAPDGAALLWKLDELWGPDARDAEGDPCAWSVGLVDAVLSDARRLLSEGLN